MSKCILWLLFLTIIIQSGCGDTRSQSNNINLDVCIYGATPSGIAAAISAAKSNKSVILIEPTGRIGGLVTNGLSHTDFHSMEALSGTFLEFTQRVKQYYINQYGADSEQVETSYEGTFGEPKVNLMIFQRMLAEFPQIKVVTNHYLKETKVLGAKIENVTFESTEGDINVEAKIFIDATYEGDLMAMAGVTYSVGREGQDIYNESLAPEIGDNQLQAYNFRFCATNDPTNRTEVKAPNGYDRKDFLDVLPILDSGLIDEVFAYPPVRAIYKAQTPALPNQKYDINDVSRGVIRLSMPGYNLKWPDGIWEERQKIYDDHIYYSTGMLYFLQHDEAVPEKYQKQANQWGWCKDEFTDNDNLPHQLYVREARRMKGKYVYTQNDSEHAGDDARAKLHTESIAMGDYGNNCHGTSHEGPQIGGRHTGEFYNPVPPYQIPYGIIIPNEIDNLLVPVAISSSHVGFCALRLEPIWTSIGQAAGHAAGLALDTKTAPAGINIDKLQQLLHKDKSATIYISDVLPGDPNFEKVQWWGTKGGLHGLNKMKRPGQRGKNLHGQYYEAAPFHEVDLDKDLDDEVLNTWIDLAKSLGASEEDISKLKKSKTRNDFLNTAYQITHPI